MPPHNHLFGAVMPAQGLINVWRIWGGVTTCVTHVFTTADDPNSRPDNTTQCTALQTTQCAVQRAKGALHVGPVDGLARQVADRIPQDLQLQVQGRPCNRKGLGAAAKTAAGL